MNLLLSIFFFNKSIRFRNGVLKRALILFFMFVTIMHSDAQSITNYSFFSGTSTFSPISGGASPSLIDDGSGWPSPDDGKANGVPIGFEFWYMGVRYTTASMSSNGWMTLGANITNSTFTNNLTSGGAPRPVIAPLWDDLNMQSTSNVSYVTTGAAGNRIFTVEYLNARWDYQASGASMSFQVKLYETSGIIEFNYNQVGGSNPNNASASIGITASGNNNGNFLSVNSAGTSASSTSETNNISARPANNKLYRFTPYIPNTPSGLNFNNIVYNGMRLNWTDNSSNEQGFVIYRSDDLGLTYNFIAQTAANTTNYTATGLSENTLYYWRVYAVSEGGISSFVAGNQATCQRPTQPASFTTSSDNVCRNQTGVSYSIPAVTGATSYTWSYSGSGGTITGGATNTISVNFSNSATSGTMSVSSVNSCGTSVPFTLAVTVSTAVPGRPGNFSTSSSTVCQGQTNVAYISGTSSNATSYTWTYSGSGTTINGTTNSITVDFSNIATNGTLAVNGTNACGNSSSNRTVSITINPLPAQPGAYTASSMSICTPQANVAYTIPAVTGASSYVWNYTGTGATISNGTTRSITIDFASNATSGVLNAAAVNTCGAGTDRPISVTVNSKPIISQIPTSGLIANYKLNGNADDATGNNQGTFQNGPTATNDRFGNTNSAYSFNGSNQFISTAIPYNNPNNFTMSLWFKTTTTVGGKLIGLGNNQTGSSSQYDRHIYMTDNGQLYLGIYPSNVKTINSVSSYNDGKWHMVTVSLSPTNGMKLYADGALIASDATTTSGENYTGYIRIGFDNTAGWTNQPSSFYFNGSLDDILIYATELSATDVATLYNSPDGAGNNGPVCSGATLTFSATSLSGATYTWTGPNSFSSSSQNPTLTYNAAATGTYTLTVTQNACSTTAYTNASPKSDGNGQWVGSVNNSWANASNWCDATIPTAASDVIIVSSAVNMPTMAGNAYAKNLTINSGATLNNSSTGILNLSGNFNNNGTYTDNGIYTDAGKVVFLGTAAQSINGTITFNNVTINNSNGVTLNSTATINGILTLSSGTFITNNNLNQNLYNGAIAGTGSGSTTGNIRFFKTIWGDKYHYISSPISGLTVADWNDNVLIKFGANSNLYSYNEIVPDTNKLVGWTSVPSVATALSPMKGYALYFPRFVYNTMLDISGAYNHSNTFTDATLTNTPSNIPFNKSASDGWNLVGNPFPSTIDWDAASGWTKTNISNAIYTYDARKGKYVSYVAGLGTNGGTRYIGSMQGFFVKVTNSGTGTVSMSNNVRVTSTLYDVWRTEEQDHGDIFRLTATSGAYSDETVLRFIDNASDGFDNDLDAYKLLNGGSSPSLFSISSAADYSINSLPRNTTDKTIPLSITTGFAGQYSFTADFSSFAGDQEIWLEDKLLGTSQNLREESVYTVDLSKGSIEGRFFINYKNNQTVTDNTNPSAYQGVEISAHLQTVSVTIPNSHGKSSIVALDALGKKVYALDNTETTSDKIEFTLPVATGIYIIKVNTGNMVASKQVYITK